MGKGRGGGQGGRRGAAAFRSPDLIAWEDGIAAKEPASEYGYSVSADGTRVETVRGTRSSTPIPGWAYQPGATSTHFHPGVYGPGDLDTYMAQRRREDAFLAQYVAKHGARYRRTG